MLTLLIAAYFVGLAILWYTKEETMFDEVKRNMKEYQAERMFENNNELAWLEEGFVPTSVKHYKG